MLLSDGSLALCVDPKLFPVANVGRVSEPSSVSACRVILVVSSLLTNFSRLSSSFCSSMSAVLFALSASDFAPVAFVLREAVPFPEAPADPGSGSHSGSSSWDFVAALGGVNGTTGSDGGGGGGYGRSERCGQPVTARCLFTNVVAVFGIRLFALLMLSLLFGQVGFWGETCRIGCGGVGFVADDCNADWERVDYGFPADFAL